MVSTAIILVGGLGTRLRPLTDSTPKPLLPMHGKPIVEHTIRQLARHGVKNIIISAGYKAEQIQDYFKDDLNLGVSMAYSIESEPLGTGGAVKKAAAGIKEPFFLVWGDNIMDINYSKMREEFSASSAAILMALTPREDVENFGAAKLEKNKIITFIEKPRKEETPSTLINAGAFVFDPSCLKMLPEGKSSLEKECFEKLAPQEKISAYIHRGQWFPTDTLEKYYDANTHFKPEINFKEKTVIIADVDDTICESCQQISPEMAEQISRMIQQGFEFAFISGTKSEDLQKMISSKVKERHHLLATTGTNYTIVDGDVVNIVYNNSFKQEEKEEIISALKELISYYQIKSLTTEEDQLQDRESQITLSAIGRRAASELKAAYDPDGAKRKEWIGFLEQHLSKDEYGLKIGGTTSIDITRKGLDKEWGIKTFADYHKISLSSIVFFGDKIYPGGNDFPATKIVDCVSVKSPEDTLKELRKIEYLNNIIVDHRPWGKFEQFTANEVSTVKILEIKAGQRLSLQSHQHREELWVALDEGVIAEVDGKINYLKTGERVFVPKGAKHRLSSEAGAVRVLEIAWGKFDEDDITRCEDDFGRV